MIPLGIFASARRVGSSVIVYDTFTRADSASSLGTADTGQAWSSVVGTWGITSNRGYPVTASGTGTAAVDTGLNPATTAMQVSARIYGIAATRFPVVFLGAAEAANHTSAYRIFPNGNTTQTILQNGNAGGAVPTSGLTLVDGDIFTIRSVPSGANCVLTLRINGVLTGSSLTVPARTGTWCGIGTGNTPDTACRFDDFTVETIW